MYSSTNLPPRSVLLERARKKKESANKRTSIYKYNRSIKRPKKRLHTPNKIIINNKFLTRYKTNLIKIPRYRKAVVRLLMARQENKCLYCKSNITYRYQIDHIQPRSTGGTNGIANLCLACPICNRAKWDIDVNVFLQYIERFKCN